MSDFMAEYKQLKAQQKVKHKKSKIRHPIRTTKKVYGRVSNTTSNYWQQGKVLGEQQLEQIKHEQKNRPKPQPQYSDRQVIHYAYSHLSTTKKVIYITLAVVVFCLIAWGIIH